MTAVPELDARSQRRAVLRKTVAVLVDYVDHLGAGYEAQLRSGFERACLKHDINLLFVVGRHLDSPDPMSAVHNGVYQLVLGGGAAIAAVYYGLVFYCGLEAEHRALLLDWIHRAGCMARAFFCGFVKRNFIFDQTNSRNPRKMLKI